MNFLTILVGVIFVLLTFKWICRKSNTLLGMVSILIGIVFLLSPHAFPIEAASATIAAGILFLAWNPVTQHLRKEPIYAIKDYYKEVS